MKVRTNRNDNKALSMLRSLFIDLTLINAVLLYIPIAMKLYSMILRNILNYIIFPAFFLLEIYESQSYHYRVL